MKKIVVIIICLATIVALFGVNNATKTFSFEDYITKVSVSAENRPDMPSTEKIDKVVNEYGDHSADDSGIINALKSVWTTLKLIYECLVYAVKFLLYLVEMLLYLINILSAMTYNLLVW